MNKKSWIIISIVLIILIIGAIFFFTNKNSSNDKTDTYEANKTSVNQDNNSNNQNNTSVDNDTKNEKNNEIRNSEQNSTQLKEEKIATFSTKIYDTDSARQNNINITCSTLNGSIVKNNDTFSFCNTVGQATSNKGYQEADIFDNNGKKKKGLGGR